MLISAGKQLASGTSAYHACVCGTSTFVSGGTTGTDVFSGYLKDSSESSLVGVKIVDDDGVIMYEHEPTTSCLSGIQFTGKAPFRIYASGSSAPYKRWWPSLNASTSYTDSAMGYIRDNITLSGSIGTASAIIPVSSVHYNLEEVDTKYVNAEGGIVSMSYTPAGVQYFRISACTYNGSAVNPVGLLCVDNSSAFDVPSSNKSTISFDYNIRFTGYGAMSAAQVIRNDGGNPGSDYSGNFTDLLQNAYYVKSAYRYALTSTPNSLDAPYGFSYGIGEYGKPYFVNQGARSMNLSLINPCNITCIVP